MSNHASHQYLFSAPSIIIPCECRKYPRRSRILVQRRTKVILTTKKNKWRKLLGESRFMERILIDLHRSNFAFIYHRSCGRWIYIWNSHVDWSRAYSTVSSFICNKQPSSTTFQNFFTRPCHVFSFHLQLFSVI